MSTPPHPARSSLNVTRKPVDQLPGAAPSTGAPHSQGTRTGRSQGTRAEHSRDPKAGVAHRPDGRNYVRHKIGLTVEEWEALDRVGAYLFPKLKSAGQRPSRGMIVGELLNRL